MSTEELPDTLTMGKGLTLTFLKNEAFITRIHVSGAADADTLVVPPHWHEKHNDIFRVLKGQAEVMIGSSVKLYGPEDGEVMVLKGVVHSLKTYPGVECILEERTEPMDDEKELFFRNFLWRGSPPTNFFEIMQAFYHGDGRPAFPIHIPWLESAFVTVMGGYIAPTLGYKRKYETLKKV